MEIEDTSTQLRLAYSSSNYADFIVTSDGSFYLSSGSGNVGIGVVPINPFEVNGGMAVGNANAGTEYAPSQGLIVEGSVGIGI